VKIRREKKDDLWATGDSDDLIQVEDKTGEG
jgi:hypothetical protein